MQYENYKKLIYKLSYKWGKILNLDIDELISEGNLIFVLCQESFNPTKSCFSTYLQTCLVRHFQQMKNRNKMKYEEIDFQFASNENLELKIEKVDAYQKLSIEAKEIIETILNCPSEIKEMLVSPIFKVFSKKKVIAFIKRKFKNNKTVLKELNQFANEI